MGMTPEQIEQRLQELAEARDSTKRIVGQYVFRATGEFSKSWLHVIDWTTGLPRPRCIGHGLRIVELPTVEPREPVVQTRLVYREIARRPAKKGELIWAVDGSITPASFDSEISQNIIFERIEEQVPAPKPKATKRVMAEVFMPVYENGKPAVRQAVRGEYWGDGNGLWPTNIDVTAIHYPIYRLVSMEIEVEA